MVHEIFKNLKNILYVDPSRILDANWDFSKEKIESLKNFNFILDCSGENYGENSALFYHKYLSETDCNFLLLSSNPNDHLIRDNILFYPYWYFQSIKDFEINQTYKDVRKYKISCLNGNHRPHRIFNFLTMKNKNYFNDVLFKIVYDKDEIPWREDDIVLPEKYVLEWDQIKNSLPSTKKTHPYIDDPAWNDSYINFVTETTVNKGLFVTEKSWKPIASEQLFIIYGNIGTITHLRELGVDTFDDIIDHSYYDKVTDWEERLYKIHEIIERLLKQDIEQIFVNTKERRFKNRQMFNDGEFGRIFADCIKEKCIDMLQ